MNYTISPDDDNKKIKPHIRPRAGHSLYAENGNSELVSHECARVVGDKNSNTDKASGGSRLAIRHFAGEY